MNLTQIPFMILALIPALTFHEWAHAIVARYFGDNTAERLGRLTLNPLAHLDPLGTLAILFVGFGWAKPVPIDPRQFRSSWAEFFVASAGPAMNIILATVFAMVIRSGVLNAIPAEHSENIYTILQISIVMNLSLAFFNLIPLGPLDGHSILARLLPLRTSLRFSAWNLQYGGVILFGVILADSLLKLNILRTVIGLPVALVRLLLLG